MINTILFLISLITPRSFAMFETPFTSLLSKSTTLFYPSLVSGFVPEFYLDPYKGQGYFTYSKGFKGVMPGGMLYTSKYGLMALTCLKKNKNSVGIGVNYTRGTGGVNTTTFSFSHRASTFGYDIGALFEKRSEHNYYSAYLRAFRSMGDETDIVLGLRGIKEENTGFSGFGSLIFSPVSGEYLEWVLGYSPWLRDIYVSLGMSHQFYKNIAFNLGLYYPFKTFDNAPFLSHSYLETPGVLPSYPDFRIGVDIYDNSSMYALSVSLDHAIFKDFIASGSFSPSLYNFNLSLSVYFYSF